MKNEILVVEDDVVVRDVICATLVEGGFSTAACRTGAEALRLSREACYKAIIIDHYLPAETGTETTKHLRDRCPGSLIIGISGSHDGSDFAAAGGDMFLRKPIDLTSMVHYLRLHLS